MIATLANTTPNNLKSGAVLTVTGARSASEAQKQIADFLLTSQRDDLAYFMISENYFLIYSKPNEQAGLA